MKTKNKAHICLVFDVSRYALFLLGMATIEECGKFEESLSTGTGNTTSVTIACDIQRFACYSQTHGQKLKNNTADSLQTLLV